MKKALFISCLLFMLVSGCRKDPGNASDASYHTTTINGLKDITIKTIDSINIPLTISSNDRDHYVTLEISGVPNYLHAGFTPAIGVPNFATYLSLKSYRGVAGNKYTLKLKTKTEAGIEDTFDLHVNVEYDKECVDHAVGTYSSHYECTKSGGFNGSDVNIEKTASNTIVAKNLQIGQNTKIDSVQIDVNCEQVSLTIPDQWRSPGLHFFEGQGTFLLNHIQVTYTVELWETCTVTLTKQ